MTTTEAKKMDGLSRTRGQKALPLTPWKSGGSPGSSPDRHQPMGGADHWASRDANQEPAQVLALYSRVLSIGHVNTTAFAPDHVHSYTPAQAGQMDSPKLLQLSI